MRTMTQTRAGKARTIRATSPKTKIERDVTVARKTRKSKAQQREAAEAFLDAPLPVAPETAASAPEAPESTADDVVIVEETVASPKAKRAPRAKTAKDGAQVPPIAPKRQTKETIVIELMQREGGVLLDEICAVTNWQRHSVRGFVSGNLRKMKNLNVVSTKEGKTTRYSLEGAAE